MHWNIIQTKQQKKAIQFRGTMDGGGDQKRPKKREKIK